MVKLVDGYTLMHEHIFIDLSGPKADLDCRLDNFQATVEDLKELFKLGVRNILEVTNIGMGRDRKFMDKVAEASSINIIYSTGFYKEPFLPQGFNEKSDYEWEKILEEEIKSGLADVVGECGTSRDKAEENEKRVMNICANTAKKCNVPITTHTTLGTLGLEQAQFLLKKGLKAKKIIIGHQDLAENFANVLKILEMGVNVGFDTIGKNNYSPDELRIEKLLKIKEKGYLDQIVLSLDITRKSQLKRYGGYGRAYLFENFLPRLKKAGFDDKDINKILIENPRRILG